MVAQFDALQLSTPPSFPITLTQLFINGEWRNSSSGKTFDVIDPTTEAVIAHVAEATKEDTEAAIAAAHRAFEQGAWGQMSGHERSEIL